MRPDIPWNVAGIPPEAREAARAAARREGLSVGEWMTRRILRSFSDSPDDAAPTREPWSSNGNGYGAPETRAAQTRRDTENMLERVARSESESNDVYRRIEEQMRNVARRLESAERNQAESNRAMSKAAAEINVTAREQAQAFDQLGDSVTGLADRLERVEHSATQDGTRDAIKGLHNGLSRLADQITNTANQSASQISALAGNLEALAGRLAQARQETERATHAIDQRVSQIDHKVAVIDQSMSHMSALDERLRAVERAAQASNEVLTHTVQSIEARKDEEAAALRRDTETASAIARLEDNLSRLQARESDPAIDRRLSSIERSLSDIVTRFETTGHADTLESEVKRLTQRIEKAEARQREQVADLRAAMNTAPTHADPFEPAPAAAAVPPPVFAPQQSFEAPPFAEPSGQPFQVSADPFAPAIDQASATPFAAEAAFGQGALPSDPFAAASPPPLVEPDNYLAAARRSARAAAAQAEAERGSRVGSFSWGAAASAPADTAGGSKKTYLWIAIIALLAIIAIAVGAVLSQKLASNSFHSVSVLFPKKQAVPPAAPAPLPANTPGPAAIKPSTAEVKPLQSRIVSPAPVHTLPTATPAGTTTPPATATNPTPAPSKPNPTAAAAPLDKLTQLANAGNAKAELVVGLKYLEGDGVAVNEAEAAKWLERAAEQGLAVAQYRLGTLYERGRGVPADMARAVHWYQLAAQAGNRKAMHNLAVAYATGAGTDKNLAEAARWFSKAAALGLADSEFNLAVLYERGMGVPQSLIDAYKWYAIAAAGGDTQSKARIDALSTQLSADDRAAAQRAAESFHAQPLAPKANVAPQLTDVVQ
jgi:localization factor PodJL